jgi:hypothetical protein
MSFIYNDKQLINMLYNAGRASLKKEAKLAGVAGTAQGTNVILPPTGAETLPIDPSSETIAKALLISLQRNLDPGNAPPVVQSIPLGTQEGKPVPAKPENFRTLGDFIQWAAKNKLTWAGKRFAWLPEESEDAKKEKAAQFTSYPSDRSKRDPITRSPINVSAWALPQPIRDYLTHILKTDAVTNTTLRVMLQGVIRELNSSLPESAPIPDKITDLGIPYSKLSGVDPALAVDGFNGFLLDPTNPLVGLEKAPDFYTFPVKLTLGDLDSYERFLNWLKRMQVKDKSGAIVPVEGRIDSDPCPVIHMLYQRAMALFNKKTTYTQVANFDKAIDRYVEAVKQYGPKFTNPQGQACAVTSAGGISAATGPAPAPATGAPAVGATGAAGAAGAGGDSALLTEALEDFFRNNLPLQNGQIDLAAIQRFTGGVTRLVPQNSEIISYIAECNKIISLIQDKFLLSAYFHTPIIINSSSDVILNRLKTPELKLFEKGNLFCPLIRQLKLLVLAVIGLFNGIQKLYKNQLENSPNLNAKLVAQVGTIGFYRGSVAGSNLYDLDDFLSYCPRI